MRIGLTILFAFLLGASCSHGRPPGHLLDKEARINEMQCANSVVPKDSGLELRYRQMTRASSPQVFHESLDGFLKKASQRPSVDHYCAVFTALEESQLASSESGRMFVLSLWRNLNTRTIKAACCSYDCYRMAVQRFTRTRLFNVGDLFFSKTHRRSSCPNCDPA